MKKIISIIMTLLLLSLTTLQSAPASAAALEGKLVISELFNYEDANPLVIAAMKYMELHPGVTITFESEFGGDDYSLPLEEQIVRQEAYRQRLLTGLMSGESADIVNLSFINPERIAASGLLYDLNEFAWDESSVQRSDLFENILRALEMDGKLYYIAASFGFDYVKLNTRMTEMLGINIGEYEEISCAELLDMYVGALGGALADSTFFTFPDYGKNAFLSILGLTDFLDMANGEARFGTPEFLSYLEKTNRIYTKNPSDNVFYATWDLSQFEYQNNSFAILASGALNSIGLILAEREHTSVGVPLTSYTGEQCFNTNTLYGIPRGTQNPELAWDFLNFFLGDAESAEGSGFFPLHMENFEALLVSELGAYFPNDAESKMLEVKAVALKKTKKSVAYEEMDVLGILSEFYDQGLTTAEQCAEKLQNKAEIYIKE